MSDIKRDKFARAEVIVENDPKGSFTALKTFLENNLRNCTVYLSVESEDVVTLSVRPDSHGEYSDVAFRFEGHPHMLRNTNQTPWTMFLREIVTSLGWYYFSSSTKRTYRG